MPEKLRDGEFTAFRKSPAKAVDLASLRAHPVGHIKGWKIYDQLTAGAVAVTTTNDAEQLFRLLDLGRIDTALYERWLGLALPRRSGMNDLVALENSFMSLGLTEAQEAHLQQLVRGYAELLINIQERDNTSEQQLEVVAMVLANLTK